MNANTLQKLRVLNFQELIHLDCEDVSKYSFNRQSGPCHPKILAYCVDCDKEDPPINTATDGSGFELNNISHGTTACDIFAALPEEERPDLTDFHHDSVMFVFESPGGNKFDKDNHSCKQLFQPVPYRKDSLSFSKCPTQKWYWIPTPSAWAKIKEKQTECQATKTYPCAFRGGKYGYGELILSVLLTFKLDNAYVTNLVKCGMNDSEGKKSKGIKFFHPKCVDHCYSRFLQKEIKIMSPKVIFTFGTATTEKLEYLLKQHGEPIPIIQQLPHPAAFWNSSDNFMVLYFWLILRGLIRATIVSKEDAAKLAQTYLSHEFPT